MKSGDGVRTARGHCGASLHSLWLLSRAGALEGSYWRGRNEEELAKRATTSELTDVPPPLSAHDKQKLVKHTLPVASLDVSDALAVGGAVTAAAVRPPPSLPAFPVARLTLFRTRRPSRLSSASACSSSPSSSPARQRRSRRFASRRDASPSSSCCGLARSFPRLCALPVHSLMSICLADLTLARAVLHRDSLRHHPRPWHPPIPHRPTRQSLGPKPLLQPPAPYPLLPHRRLDRLPFDRHLAHPCLDRGEEDA